MQTEPTQRPKNPHEQPTLLHENEGHNSEQQQGDGKEAGCEQRSEYESSPDGISSSFAEAGAQIR